MQDKIIIIETKDKENPDISYFEALVKTSDDALKDLSGQRVNPLYYYD